MKRGGELKRNAPLVRSGIVHTKQQTPLRRVGQIRQVSRKRMASQPSRRRAETLLGRDRYGNGVCACCGMHGPVNGHERRARSQGGDPTRPDCLLCPVCNGWCEDNPRDAAAFGWKLSRKYPSLPDVPQAIRTDGAIHHFGGTA